MLDTDTHTHPRGFCHRLISEGNRCLCCWLGCRAPALALPPPTVHVPSLPCRHFLTTRLGYICQLRSEEPQDNPASLGFFATGQA